MAKYVSNRNPISTNALKRKSKGTVVIRHHDTYETIKFTRCAGGWKREVSIEPRVDIVVVPSADVADECNSAVGCKESWAKVY